MTMFAYGYCENFYLLPPVSKFCGVFGGRKLFLLGHFGLYLTGG